MKRWHGSGWSYGAMNVIEQDIEDYLYSNPLSYYNGDASFEWCGRQVQVASGIIDLLGFEYGDDWCYVHVVELKAFPLKPQDLAQVCRYAADLDEICSLNIGNCDIVKCLIGTGVVSNEMQFAADAMHVKLREVSVEFRVSGAWGWKDEAAERHWETNEKAYNKYIEPVKQKWLGIDEGDARSA